MRYIRRVCYGRGAAGVVETARRQVSARSDIYGIRSRFASRPLAGGDRACARESHVVMTHLHFNTASGRRTRRQRCLRAVFGRARHSGSAGWKARPPARAQPASSYRKHPPARGRGYSARQGEAEIATGVRCSNAWQRRVSVGADRFPDGPRRVSATSADAVTSAAVVYVLHLVPPHGQTKRACSACARREGVGGATKGPGAGRLGFPQDGCRVRVSSPLTPAPLRRRFEKCVPLFLATKRWFRLVPRDVRNELYRP